MQAFVFLELKDCLIARTTVLFDYCCLSIIVYSTQQKGKKEVGIHM